MSQTNGNQWQTQSNFYHSEWLKKSTTSSRLRKWCSPRRDGHEMGYPPGMAINILLIVYMILCHFISSCPEWVLVNVSNLSWWAKQRNHDANAVIGLLGCWGCSCWWLGGSYDNTDGEPKMAEAIIYAFKKVTFVHITCMYTYNTHIYVHTYIYI